MLNVCFGVVLLLERQQLSQLLNNPKYYVGLFYKQRGVVVFLCLLRGQLQLFSLLSSAH